MEVVKCFLARVVKLVDALDSKSGSARSVGSSPTLGTNHVLMLTATNHHGTKRLNFAGRQDKGRPAAFQAEDRGVRLSLPAPIFLYLLF